MISSDLIGILAATVSLTLAALSGALVWSAGARYAVRQKDTMRQTLGDIQEELIALHKRYNDELEERGVLQVEIAQLRTELERQRDVIGQHYRAIRDRDTYISEILVQYGNVPFEGLPPLPPTRPPPIQPQPNAPRQIDPHALRNLAGILNQPWLGTREARDSYLLAGLPVGFVSKITRAPDSQADLINIVTMAHGWGADTFRTLLQNAAVALDISESAGALEDWCRAWGFLTMIPRVA